MTKSRRGLVLTTALLVGGFLGFVVACEDDPGTPTQPTMEPLIRSGSGATSDVSVGPLAEARSESKDSESEDSESEDSELVDPTCVVANGLTWCFDDSACGEACNAVCASKGLTPVADSTVWFNAQNDLAECQAISQAFGLGTTVDIGFRFFACLVDSFGPHSAGGGILSPLFCSTDSECPDRHRTITEDLGVACGGSSRRAICPCE